MDTDYLRMSRLSQSLVEQLVAGTDFPHPDQIARRIAAACERPEPISRLKQLRLASDDRLILRWDVFDRGPGKPPRIFQHLVSSSEVFVHPGVNQLGLGKALYRAKIKHNPAWRWWSFWRQRFIAERVA